MDLFCVSLQFIYYAVYTLSTGFFQAMVGAITNDKVRILVKTQRLA